MQFGPAEIIAAIALLLHIMNGAFSILRRVARGSFATQADVRALEKTMETTHQLTTGRIIKVEHANEMLEERMSHFPDRKQWDGLKDDIAEVRKSNAVIEARLEEVARMRESVDGLTREIRENRK
jgi:uncharacterized ferredoxin-like protein